MLSLEHCAFTDQYERPSLRAMADLLSVPANSSRIASSAAVQRLDGALSPSCVARRLHHYSGKSGALLKCTQALSQSAPAARFQIGNA